MSVIIGSTDTTEEHPAYAPARIWHTLPLPLPTAPPAGSPRAARV